MTKKQTDHSWGSGIMAIACGYAINAKPGPEKQHPNQVWEPQYGRTVTVIAHSNVNTIYNLCAVEKSFCF